MKVLVAGVAFVLFLGGGMYLNTPVIPSAVVAAVGTAMVLFALGPRGIDVL